MLTDTSEAFIDRVKPWCATAQWAFLVYALVRHVDWQDALAAWCLLGIAVRAFGRTKKGDA